MPDDKTPSATGPAALLNQLKGLWTKQGKGVKLIAIVAIIGILGAVVVLNFVGKTEGFVAIAEGASPDDAQELLAALQTRNITAHLKDGHVEVAQSDLEAARAAAAAAGLPHTGKGFELFDGSNLGQSSFAEQVNYRRALQGELQRSITSLAQVQGARVHIALGRHSVFKDQSEKPTASVALHLHPGQTLSAEQVRGVRQLVAASIEGLAADAVVVVDNHGNLLDAASATSTNQKADLEHGVALRVRTMLERIVGAGKVSVVATATVDDSKSSQTEEKFDNEHPVVRSETLSADGMSNEQIQVITSGVAGVRGNLGGGAAGGVAGNGSGSGAAGGRINDSKQYEISRRVSQTEKTSAKLEKLQLAVVIDYKSDDKGKPVARTDKELQELTAVARQAAGIDETRGDKIEVRSFPFAADPDAADVAPPVAAPAELPIMYIAAGGGALVLLIVVALFLKARKRSKARNKPVSLALPAPIAELERVLDATPVDEKGHVQNPPKLDPAIADAARAGLPPGKAVRERVLDIVRDDVERAAEILTSWLSEVPPTNAVKGASK